MVISYPSWGYCVSQSFIRTMSRYRSTQFGRVNVFSSSRRLLSCWLAFKELTKGARALSKNDIVFSTPPSIFPSTSQHKSELFYFIRCPFYTTSTTQLPELLIQLSTESRESNKVVKIIQSFKVINIIQLHPDITTIQSFQRYRHHWVIYTVSKFTMALSVNRMWTWIFIAQILKNALPFAFSKNINQFIKNIPLTEIFLAISIYNMANNETTVIGTIVFSICLAFNKMVENLTPSDTEKLFQQIQKVPRPIWESMLMLILFGLVIHYVFGIFGAICVFLRDSFIGIINAVSTISSNIIIITVTNFEFKLIEPISVSTILSKAFDAVKIVLSKAFDPVKIVLSKALDTVREIAKYACISILILLVLLIFGLVVLVSISWWFF